MKRILVLFPKEWDRLEFARPEYASRYEFVYAGFDLFRFPQNLQLGWFDAFRFVNEVVARFRRERIDGVFSNNEYFGPLRRAALRRSPAREPRPEAKEFALDPAPRARARRRRRWRLPFAQPRCGLQRPRAAQAGRR